MLTFKLVSSAAFVASDWSCRQLSRSASGKKMSKQYQVIKDRVPRPGGGFVEAFRMAIVEFTCLGERQFDVAGYPYATEGEALATDWAALGLDFRNATTSIMADHGKEAPDDARQTPGQSNSQP